MKEYQDVPISTTCKDVCLDADHCAHRPDPGCVWWHNCAARRIARRVSIACRIGIACRIAVACRVSIACRIAIG